MREIIRIVRMGLIRISNRGWEEGMDYVCWMEGGWLERACAL